MRKIFAGGAALAFAGAGSVALAGPLGAQDAPDTPQTQLEASISATTVGPGENLTVSSVDSCTVNDGYAMYGMWVDVYPASATEQDYADGVGVVGEAFLPAPALAEHLEFEDTDIFTGEVTDDGSFTVSFDAPDVSDSYNFFAYCLQVEEGYYDWLDSGEEPPTTEPPTEPPTTEPPADDDDHGDHDEPPVDEVLPLTGDDDHGDHDDEPPVDDEEPPVDDEEPPVDEEPPPVDEEPGGDDMPEPGDFDLIDDEVFIVGFQVTGGSAAPAAPVTGQPSFTG